MTTPLVTPWADSTPTTESTLMQLCAAQGLNPFPWSNGPHNTYSAYTKVIYVVHGSITFGLPELNQQHTLKAGDRLDLPANTIHDAVVGPQGVTCLEAHT